ncbi:carbohydrate kinase, thermoresistant glucokinase family [Burkholderiales bacterium JOSHI_001]|nr:carbohydrate kinase, thermoresistant glucokinase family [Burkholderiales bacterium JOSHI_001]
MTAPRVVVMGVSGCGKSTVGRALARTLGVHYVEGDELHPAANVQRMAAGIPLTDADRHGWLVDVGQQLANATAQERGVVVACSALKRGYRDLLRAAAPDLRLVHLQGDEATLSQRLATRQGHYMPASLLHSQLLTLQPPEADEAALVLDIQAPAEQLAAQAALWLKDTPA